MIILGYVVDEIKLNHTVNIVEEETTEFNKKEIEDTRPIANVNDYVYFSIKSEMQIEQRISPSLDSLIVIPIELHKIVFKDMEKREELKKALQEYYEKCSNIEYCIDANSFRAYFPHRDYTIAIPKYNELLK